MSWTWIIGLGIAYVVIGIGWLICGRCHDIDRLYFLMAVLFQGILIFFV